jgi:anti-sigma factor RsiW
MAPELHAMRADVAQGALNSCTWIASGMGYAVITKAPDQTLDQIADHVSRQAGNAG